MSKAEMYAKEKTPNTTISYLWLYPMMEFSILKISARSANPVLI